MSSIEKIGDLKTISTGDLRITLQEYAVLKLREKIGLNSDPWFQFYINQVLENIGHNDTELIRDLLLLHFGWRKGEMPSDIHGRKFVLDVDETLFNSVYQHWVFLTKLLPLYFNWDPARMPSYEEVCRANGTHAAYIAAAPTMDHYKSDYGFLNQEMRFNKTFNSNQALIEGALEALNVLAPQVLLYLTTRPVSLSNLTHDELVRAGYPDRSVIARPDEVPLNKTSMWKILHLAEISYRNKCSVVMVDDSVTTHQMIEDLGLPHIQSILINGPMTPDNHPKARSWQEVILKEGELCQIQRK